MVPLLPGASPHGARDPGENGWRDPGGAGGYAPIGDYAAVGDCHGLALVSLAGSVDWCCLERFDTDPVLCRLLDARRGGFLSIAPAQRYRSRRAYLPGTNLLRTEFETEGGRVAVTDFMPVGREPKSGVHDYVTLRAPFWLVRLVEGVEGRVPLELRFRASEEYGLRAPGLRHVAGGLVAGRRAALSSDFPLAIEGSEARAELELAAGERRAVVLSPEPIPGGELFARVERGLAVTRAFWEEWSAYCRYGGPWREEVARSMLALKVLTYAPSGAIVAAPTTSLPECIGGERNWDYRFCWLRDATFTLYALAAVGYSGEGKAFSRFLVRAGESTAPELCVLYGIDEGSETAERELSHLEGYRGSRPVRIGNGAAHQRQNDVYGEVLDWAWLFRGLGGRFDRDARDFLRGVVRHVCEGWEEPDQGLWEMRGPPRHHVFGKILGWVALDRCQRLFGRDPELARAAGRIRADVLEKGVAPGGWLRQAYDLEEPDASLLLVPFLGFPLEDALLLRTIERIRARLGRGDHLLRYVAEDGLAGSEGAFLICSFWLVDALLWAGRIEEARGLYGRLLSSANDVGLYSEEIDPATGHLLGNFPQAFTHLAQIQAAVHLSLCEKQGCESLRGTNADRARRLVGATMGWRALWAVLRKTGRVGRLRSSRHSILRGP